MSEKISRLLLSRSSILLLLVFPVQRVMKISSFSACSRALSCHERTIQEPKILRNDGKHPDTHSTKGRDIARNIHPEEFRCVDSFRDSHPLYRCSCCWLGVLHGLGVNLSCVGLVWGAPFFIVVVVSDAGIFLRPCRELSPERRCLSHSVL